MEQRINARSDAAIWMERIVWNAAAGAVLAIMILVLLGSLRWLEAVAPATVGARPAVSSAGPNASAPAEIDQSIPAVDFNRPSG